MVGPRVYHLKHARSYPSFTANDPAKIMDLAAQWLKRHDFNIKRKSKQYSRGSKRGIHVNHVPKFKLYIEQGVNGNYVVRFDYYAKIKLGTAVVVGVLTSGISTVVGVGTLAIQLADADHFVDKFWKHIDSLARGAPVILTMERWASDGKGNFVKQPTPAPPVAVAAMPGQQPPHPQQFQQQPPHPQQFQQQPPHPQQFQQQPQQFQQQHQQYQPQHFQQQPPHSQQGVLHAPPAAPPLPPHHGAQHPPHPQYNYGAPGPIVQHPPPQIQPGQVYGNNHAIRLPTMSNPAPPPTASYPPPTASYPRVETPASAGYPNQARDYASPSANIYPEAPRTSDSHTSYHSSYPAQNNYNSSAHNSYHPSPVHNNYAPATSPAHANYAPPTATHNNYPTAPAQNNTYRPPPTPYPPATPANLSSTTSSNYPPPPTPSHSNYPPPTPASTSSYNYYPTTQTHYPPPPPSADGNRTNVSNIPPPSRDGVNTGDSKVTSAESLKDAETRSYHGNNVDILSFNIKDEKGMAEEMKRRSGESVNPWDSQRIENTRKELYPQITKQSGAPTL